MKTTRILLALSTFCTLFNLSANGGEAFTKIILDGNAKIFLRQDTAYVIRYSGNNDDFDAETSIKNGTLTISGNPDNDINISLPKLEEVKISGNGSVTGVSTFKVNDLFINIDGDGKIVLDVEGNKINSTISGLGKIILSGTAEEATLSIPVRGRSTLWLKDKKSYC
jgi:hypothetical protein